MDAVTESSRDARYSLRLYLYIILAVFITYRASLVGKGTLATWDDTRYLILAEALGALELGGQPVLDFKKLLEAATSGTLGRPGVLLFWGPLICIQRYLTPAHMNFFHPDSLIVPQMGSLVFSATTLILFSRFVLLITNRNYLATIASVLLYGALTNSTYYVRSINPFDAALCCAFASLIFAWRVRTNACSLFAGFLAGMTFITYPGYFWCVVMIAVTLLSTTLLKDKGRCVGLYFLGVVIVPFTVELLTSVAGVSSYSDVLTYLVPTVSRGEPKESLIFPFRYLFNVEGVLGIMLVLLSSIVSLQILPKFIRDYHNLSKSEWIFTCGLLGMFLHGCSGVLFSAPVFYGRLLHGYLPFLCLAPTIALSSSDGEPRKSESQGKGWMLAAAIAVTAVIHVGSDTLQFSRIAYPRDVFYSLLSTEAHWENARRIHQSDRCSPTTREPSFRALDFPIVEQSGEDFTLVNFCDFYEISKDYREIPQTMDLKVYGEHFIHFPAYSFEGYSPVERSRIGERRYLVASSVREITRPVPTTP